MHMCTILYKSICTGLTPKGGGVPPQTTSTTTCTRGRSTGGTLTTYYWGGVTPPSCSSRLTGGYPIPPNTLPIYMPEARAWAQGPGPMGPRGCGRAGGGRAGGGGAAPGAHGPGPMGPGPLGWVGILGYSYSSRNAYIKKIRVREPGKASSLLKSLKNAKKPTISL